VCPFALVTVLVPLLHVIMPEGLVSLYPFGVHVMVLVSCVPCAAVLYGHVDAFTACIDGIANDAAAIIKSDRTKIFFISKINTMTR
jgi:hypothetical protein